MNDIVKEAFDRLEKAVREQTPSDRQHMLKDAELLAVPAVAAAAAAAYIASRRHREPEPAANDQTKTVAIAAPEEAVAGWTEHPRRLTPPAVDLSAQTTDPLILEVERAAPAFEPHAAVLGPMAQPPPPAAAPPETPAQQIVVTDPLILELEAGRAPTTIVEPELAPFPTSRAIAEPQRQWVDHRISPPPFWAEPTPAAVPATQSQDDPSGQGVDPVLAGFDHVVCLVGYGLLFASVCMFGVPALAALALAYVHKSDSHLLVRSHFRFQLRIFWTAMLFLALAVVSLLLGAGMGVSWLFHLAQSNPALHSVTAQAGAWSGGAAGLMLLAAVLLTAVAALWTLGASVLGFLRLLANKPIGHEQAM